MANLKVKFKFSMLICCMNISVVLPIKEIVKPTDVYEEFWSGESSPENIRSATFEITKKIMDDQVDPCDNFYEYSCGNWGNINPIPKDSVSHNVFAALENRLLYYLKRDLFQADNVDGNSSSEANYVNANSSDSDLKLKDFLKSCMDIKEIEETSPKTAKSFLQGLHGWNFTELDELGNKFDWLNLTSYLHFYSEDLVLRLNVLAGVSDKSRLMLYIGGGKLFFEKKDRYNFANEGEKDHFYYMYNYLIKSVFKRSGLDVKDIGTTVNDIIDFEVGFANFSYMEQPYKNNTEIMIQDLQNIAPGIDWQKYISMTLRRPIGMDFKIIIHNEEYVKNLTSFLSKYNPTVIAKYLLFRIAADIDKIWTENVFETKKRRIRTRTGERSLVCIQYSVMFLNNRLSEHFARNYFEQDAKKEFDEMLEAIKYEFHDFINRTSWIDEIHKELAFTKLEQIHGNTGFKNFNDISQVSHNEEYSSIAINSGHFLENIIALTKLKNQKYFDLVGKPIKEYTLDIEPFNVNAYYFWGELIFPMGIFTPPFYHKYAPGWVKFGGIGSVIGHEMVHGFDSSNMLLDTENNVHDFKNLKVIGKYYARSVCMAQQYDRYKVNQENTTVKGSQTLDENISDNGGMILALDAYRKWLMRNPDEARKEAVPGLDLSPEQLFFLSFAQISCETLTRKGMLEAIKNEQHAPAKFRVIGSVANSDSFSTAFNCPFASPMNPVRKCKYD